MTTTTNISSNGSVPLVSVCAALLAILGAVIVRAPKPELDWEGVVVPAAREYADQALQLSTTSSTSDYFSKEGNENEKTEGISSSGSSSKPLAPPLHGFRIAVTGATSGIGLGLTRRLHELGASVIAIGRSPKKLKDLQSELPGIETVLADFSDLESIAKAAHDMTERFDRLDCLVNNAGIHTGIHGMFHNEPTKQGYDLTWGTNYLSHFLLTEKLIPLLQKSKYPKIVQMSSTFHFAVDGSDIATANATHEPIASQPGGSVGFYIFRSQRQYANSKLAQILHARSLMENYPDIRAVSVCPTWVGTQISGAQKGTLLHSFFQSTTFDMNGHGLSSALHAILDPPSKEKNGDFYVNTRLLDDMFLSKPINSLPGWAYQTIPIRDIMVGGSAFTFLYFLQGFMPTRRTTKSSIQSYDKTLQKELYSWSKQAVSEWL